MTNTNWIKELEEKIPNLLLIEYNDGRKERIEPVYSDLKQFITDLLEQEKKKWLEELPKEKEIKYFQDETDDQINHLIKNGERFINTGWNDYFQTIKNNLKYEKDSSRME